MKVQPIEQLILQAFTGEPMTRHDVARWLDDGRTGRCKLAADFCFVVLNQMYRAKLLTRTDNWYQLAEKGRQIVAESTQTANNDMSVTNPAGCVRREN